jgi:alkaline phosphatase D
MRTYATMLKSRPDFFIHNGDNIYADGPIAAEQKMPNGEVWRNIVSEDKSKAAETLQEFRGNYKYNLLDKNLRAFNAEVPIFTQWDDHEVTNNWWPGEPLTRAEHQRRKYAEKNATLLSARAARAFHEYMPRRRLSRVVSIARFPTVPCSMSSCSTCAAIAGPTVKTRKTPTAPLPISLVQHKSPG